MNTTAAATRRAMLALPSLLAATAGRAQPSWPDRPVRLLVGYPLGGPTDFIGRLAATGLQAAWGQTGWSRTAPAPRPPSRRKRCRAPHRTG
jgi:tripartite-type tricarboxylate transporter receptor subunit TctC